MDEPLDMNKLGKGRPGPWDDETIKMKRIAHRTAKWDYSGGDIGNIWIDTKGKQYHHIVSIMETYYKDNRNFIVDYKNGEIFLEDEVRDL